MPSDLQTPTDAENGLSRVLVSVMKGVTFQEGDPDLWQTLLQVQTRVRDWVGLVGLELILDEAEGFAYLRQRRASDEESDLPRLVPRRQLSYPVSLLLALLRKKLAEFDATSGESRLIVQREEIVDQIRLFLPDTVNEVKLIDRIDTHIKRIVELGFLRPLRGQADHYEVRRILKAFVDAQWLNEFDGRLAEYREHAKRNAEAEERGA